MPFFSFLTSNAKLGMASFEAHLLDNTFANKIDCFTYYDRDRETKFEIYLYNITSTELIP